MKKEMIYDICLDIGTNSVGWATIDELGRLVKKRKKNFWGVRLFSEGKTAEKRRLNRGTRRRLKRRKERLKLLREIFSKDILAIDSSFFIRLKESYLQDEDRSLQGVTGLFNGSDISDKEFTKKFKTIYHLRKELIESKEKFDIRYIYLAIHHIIKYRGNFLYEGQSFSDINSNISDTIDLLREEVRNLFNIEIDVENETIIKAMEEKGVSRSKKVENILLNSKLNKGELKILKDLFSGILGLKLNLEKFFGREFKKEKLELSSSSAEEDFLEIIEEATVEGDILNIMKSIYSWVQLQGILKGEKYLSVAKVKQYDIYKEELKELKEILKAHLTKEDVKKVFNDRDGLYQKYCKSIDKKKFEDEKFYKELKVFLDKIKLEENNKDFEKLQNIKIKMEDKRFLTKTNVRDNGGIPYQLGLMELEKIIENQGKYYDVLRTEKDKIISLLTFRIPYYIGVLNKHSEFAWIERKEGKEGEKIYPWNLEEVVDVDKTAEGFIRRMTSYCAYLENEEVMPDKSLMYADFKFYNELNKIRVNGEFLDIKEKELIREKIFEKQKNVSQSTLEEYFEKRQMGGEKVEIQGLQGDKKFNSTLNSYVDFTKIFGKITEENRDEIERIIYFLTVFNDNKIIERNIRNEFPKITDKAIKEILKLKYDGWGRLSKKLLYEIKSYDKKSIIEKLEKTNDNFMQIINKDEYGFNKKIEEHNLKECGNEKMNYETLVKSIQGSPAIKKGIWQSIKVVEEIKEIMGCEPRKIYIEVAKSDEKKERTIEKVDKLKKIYEGLAKENKEDKEILKILSTKNYKINSEMIALYYSQRGKCMYSGKPLPLEDLDKYCQIDHIIPQWIIKDNSIENKVLVYSSENQRKASGKIENKIIDKMEVIWKHLYKNGLIGSKKLNNLTDRRDSFSEEAEKGFINRQLVETRQITKNIANIYCNLYRDKKTKIITIKAGLTSDLRKMLKIYKIREINDFHHAHDAYIAGVLGNYISNRYSFEKEFIYDEYMKYRNKKEDTDRKNKYGFIISSINKNYEKDSFLWDAEKEKSNIIKTLNYKDVYVTRKTEYGKGTFYKITMNKKTTIEGKGIQLKRGLSTAKYGYYQGDEKAYYNIISHKKGKKVIKDLVGIPIRISNLDSIDKEIEYMEKEGFKEISIIKRKIPKYQKIINDKGEFYLTSDTEWINARELILSKESTEIYARAKRQREVTSEELVKVYDEILKKIEIYYPIFEGVLKKIEEKRDFYIGLTNEEKTSVIEEFLKITSVAATNGNLGVLGLGKRVGRLASRRVDLEKTKFISESVTGFNKREEKY